MGRWNKIIALGYITALLFPLLTGADEVLNRGRFFPIKISFFPILLLLAIFIPVLIKSFLDNGGKELARVYNNTLWITLPFLMVALVSIAWGLHPGTYWGNGYKTILLDLFNWAILLISVAIAQSWTMRKYNRIIFIIILSSACLAIWVDFMSPGTFSTVGHRAAGFYGNANQGAMSIVFLTIAALNWKKNDVINLAVLIVCGLAVFATLSVGGLFLYLFTILFFLLTHLQGHDHKLRKIALVVVVPLLIFYLIHPLILNIMSNSEMLNRRNSTERIDEIKGMFTGDTTFAEDHERKNLILEYWSQIQTAPMVGKGTGFSRTQIEGPHNMYLKHWVENGLLGLIVYLLLLFCSFRHFLILKDARGMVFVFIFLCSSFFDHNLLDSGTIVVLLGIFGSLSYLENSKVPDPVKSRSETSSNANLGLAT